MVAALGAVGALRVILLALTVAVSAPRVQVQASTVEDSHYVAAVVDYASPSMTGLTTEENMLLNIDALDEFMSQAAEQGADILVFPENGLMGFGNDAFPLDVPAPEDEVTPCSVMANAAKPLRELSCLAARHKMYLVVNVVHRVACSRAQSADCPASGAYDYNTNVAFDRSGKIVARYHKYNLFGERGHSVPPSVEYVTFDTDFGVRFGVFICFDILFDKPAIQLARRLGVTDFVFTTAWFSESPFLVAVQAFEGWAHGLDVTVLAAGLSYPAGGCSGSGIFRGRQGALNATLHWRAESTLLVQRVPKRPHWGSDDDPEDGVERGLERFDPVLNYGAGKDPVEEVGQLKMMRDNLTAYSTLMLPRPPLGAEVDGDQRLCHGGFCCRLRYEARGASLFQMSGAAVSMHGGYSWRRAAPDVHEAEAEAGFDGFHYRLVAFDGVRDHSGVASTGVQICGIVSCLGEALQSCGGIAGGLGSPSIKWTEFKFLAIEAEFETDGTLQFPSTQAGPRYGPLPPVAFSFQSNATSTNMQRVSMTLNYPMLDLRTFAIYGRLFARDGQKPTGY